MATLVTRNKGGVGTSPILRHQCPQCRGSFIGVGYKSRGQMYCCDICARRASGRGLLATIGIVGMLVGVGYYLGIRQD